MTPFMAKKCTSQTRTRQVSNRTSANLYRKATRALRIQNGKDTFSLLGFWRANEAEVPAFSAVLRAVLANSPNSIPPERVFSILNDTFDDDQERALADYMELSLQLQFNERSRKNECGK